LEKVQSSGFFYALHLLKGNFYGVTLQIASSFLLANAGRAVRCNLYVFKEKTQRIFAAIPHATHSIDAPFVFLENVRKFIYIWKTQSEIGLL
jgi:hypothetical protein